MTYSLPSALQPTSPEEPFYYPILRSLPTLVLYPSTQLKQKTPAKPQVKPSRKQSRLPSDLQTLGSPGPNPSVSSFAQQQSAAATSCPHYLCLLWIPQAISSRISAHLCVPAPIGTQTLLIHRPHLPEDQEACPHTFDSQTS